MDINLQEMLDQKWRDIPVGIISGIATVVILSATKSFWKTLLGSADKSKQFISNDKHTNYHILWAAYKNENRLRFMQWACMKEFINFCAIMLTMIGLWAASAKFPLAENGLRVHPFVGLLIYSAFTSHLVGRIFFKMDMIQFVYMARYFPAFIKARAVRKATANRIKHLKLTSKK